MANIKTKFSKGDYVYLILNNQIIYLKIQLINIIIGISNIPDISYKLKLKEFRNTEWINENKLFTTKEELVKNSLIKDFVPIADEIETVVIDVKDNKYNTNRLDK